jgi:phosphate transport system permease protein
MALGATQWQTIWRQVLPAAVPGIATGVILALSRAIGETAPLIVVGAATFVAFNPSGVTSPFTALPIQIFNWISQPQTDFKLKAAAAILVLLAILLAMNSAAIYLRNRFEKKW